MDKPDDLSVTEVETDSTVVYELRVGDVDVGKVIGRPPLPCEHLFLPLPQKAGASGPSWRSSRIDNVKKV